MLLDLDDQGRRIPDTSYAQSQIIKLRIELAKYSIAWLEREILNKV